MILFVLRCADAHRFEGWFRDGATYEAQEAAGEISCPICGSTQVSKAIMAPRIGSSRGKSLENLDIARAAREFLHAVRSTVEKNCDYVGEQFPEEARRIFYGEVAPRAIYGEASDEQAEALEDEGVEIARIPWVPRED